jgi:hypothetical protein
VKVWGSLVLPLDTTRSLTVTVSIMSNRRYGGTTHTKWVCNNIHHKINTKGFTPISSMHASKQDLCSYAYYTTLHIALQQSKYLLFTKLIYSYNTTLQVCIVTCCVFIKHTMKNNAIQLHQFNEIYSLFLVPIFFILSSAFLKIFILFNRSSIGSKDDDWTKVGENSIHLVKQHILTIYEVKF